MATPQQISEDNLLDDPPIMWRTKLRSSKEGVDSDAQEEYCFGKGVIGIGWARDEWRSGTDFEAIFRKIENTPWKGWGRRAAQTVDRFAHQAKTNELIWTRDRDGMYRLCQIRGAWRFDNSQKARQVDIHQVRSVAWAGSRFTSLEVPGAVVRAFSGRQSSFQRILDPDSRAYSVELWNDSLGAKRPKRPKSGDPLARLNPIDLEDLLYVWFQFSLGYLVVPGERSSSTPQHEWMLLDRRSGKPAVVQIKSGKTTVDVEALKRTADAMKAKSFVFSPSGCYSVRGLAGVTYIDPDELEAFGFQNLRLLPPRVAYWFLRSRGRN